MCCQKPLWIWMMRLKADLRLRLFIVIPRLRLTVSMPWACFKQRAEVTGQISDTRVFEWAAKIISQDEMHGRLHAIRREAAKATY